MVSRRTFFTTLGLLTASALFLSACNNRSSSQPTGFEQGKLVKNCKTFVASPDRNQQIKRYGDFIRKVALQNDLAPQLIATVIDVESNWFEYAVSSSCALGLMQLLQSSAGHDVYSHWQIGGVPSQRVLFDPYKNIEIGGKYLSIIAHRYLKVLNRKSLSDRQKWYYLTMVAYKSGIGVVRSMFGGDLTKVNRLSYEQVKSIVHRKAHNYDSYLLRHLYKMEKSWERFHWFK